jgi:DNA polymerase-3 subunit alpha
MNALYSPGPMDLIPDFIERKHGRKDVTYVHPDMEPVLNETYGIIVYQEQVMQLVRVIAGYSLAKADLVRRAMGKKDEKLMKEQEAEFIKGAVEKGYDKKTAKEIFRLIQKFADYGFNKSHSVAYSILAYYTAYLKTHYTLEFMTSQLNCRYGDMDEMVLLINDCKRMKISLELPDINICFSEFTINPDADNQILFGLTAIKNVGRTAVENIIKERTENGLFTSFVDFCSRIDTRVVNKKTLESLIYAGAFDKIESNRRKLYDHFEGILQKYAARKAEHAGQSNLFVGTKNTGKAFNILDQLSDYRDWNDREKLSNEKSVLGLYISSHPLNDYEAEINKLATLRFGDLADVETEEVDFSKLQRVRMCGVINDLKLKQSKKGNRFAVFTLEDFTGQGECVVFPKTYEEYKEILRGDMIVSVIGKAEENGNAIKVLVDEIKPLVKLGASDETVQKDAVEKIIIKVDANTFTPQKIYEMRGILRMKKGGRASICIHLKNGSKESVLELESTKIHYDGYTEMILTEIFGKDNIILQ